ncbi:unnamed protein product [Adineta ricciae]|uniref:Uncharacterized protein n=1 Tax=Adineta ricciae TaxID=249248 RepID=A0A814FCK1_ADIRI|nr:unnamed protein product [Adineta ricciae]
MNTKQGDLIIGHLEVNRFLYGLDFMNMNEECLKQISKVLANWSDADVRTVPNVMYQVRCGNDENDPGIEYQINWFMNCAETFIHNHRHSFDSLCLEGEYTESIWEVVHDDSIIYEFLRRSDNTFDEPKKISGRLCHVRSRHHFPNNILHVDTGLFHSITAKEGDDTNDKRVLTFLAKRKYSFVQKMCVLSSSPTIDSLDDDMRMATEVERKEVYDKLIETIMIRYHYSQ